MCRKWNDGSGREIFIKQCWWKVISIAAFKQNYLSWDVESICFVTANDPKSDNFPITLFAYGMYVCM